LVLRTYAHKICETKLYESRKFFEKKNREQQNFMEQIWEQGAAKAAPCSQISAHKVLISLCKIFQPRNFVLFI